MEGQIEVIDGRPYKVTERHGRMYHRKTVEIDLEDFIHSEHKAQYFGWNFTDLVRALIRSFNENFGLPDKNIKDPGALFDRRVSRHTKVAAMRTIEELTQCQISEN